MFSIGENKKYEDDFFILYNRLKNREHFSFSKYADGEMAILVDQEITNCDGWTYLPQEHSFYREKMIESFQYEDDNYFVGIGCPCCMGNERFEWMRDNSYQKDSKLTWANIFVNSNHQLYLDNMLPLYSEYDVILVATNRADIDKLPFKVKKFYGIGPLAWKDDYHLIDDIKKYIDSENIKNSLFLFCAGPLGNMMSHQLWEHNKENTYIDIGSTLDIHLGIGATRGYLGGGNNRVCNWG